MCPGEKFNEDFQQNVFVFPSFLLIEWFFYARPKRSAEIFETASYLSRAKILRYNFLFEKII